MQGNTLFPGILQRDNSIAIIAHHCELRGVLESNGIAHHLDRGGLTSPAGSEQCHYYR